MLLLTIVSFTLYSERSQRVQLFVSIIRCKTQRQRRRRFMLLLLLLSISASWEKIRSHRRSSCRSSHAVRTMTTRSGGRWRYVYARHFGSSFRKKWRSFLTENHSSLSQINEQKREKFRDEKTSLKKYLTSTGRQMWHPWNITLPYSWRWNDWTKLLSQKKQKCWVRKSKLNSPKSQRVGTGLPWAAQPSAAPWTRRPLRVA